MSQKSFYSLTGIIFLIVVIVHLLRVVNGWSVSIGTFDMPVWASWVAVVLASYLSYQGLRRR